MDTTFQPTEVFLIQQYTLLMRRIGEKNIQRFEDYAAKSKISMGFLINYPAYSTHWGHTAYKLFGHTFGTLEEARYALHYASCIASIKGRNDALEKIDNHRKLVESNLPKLKSVIGLAKEYAVWLKVDLGTLCDHISEGDCLFVFGMSKHQLQLQFNVYIEVMSGALDRSLRLMEIAQINNAYEMCGVVVSIEQEAQDISLDIQHLGSWIKQQLFRKLGIKVSAQKLEEVRLWVDIYFDNLYKESTLRDGG